jgi:hypothetical protein
MAERISKTFGYFGIKSTEWGGEYETNQKNVAFHSRGSTGSGNNKRLVSNYMKTGTFKLSSDWHPRFAAFLFVFTGKSVFKIDKHVPIIVEYIPRTNLDDPACANYGGA